MPADYDGDGKTDLAVWSPTGPNAGLWHVIRSGDGTYYNQGLGETGDIPLGRPVGQATVVDPNGPQLCGAEGSLCSFSGLTMDVTYGLNGTFKLLTNVTDLLNCSANTFGTVAPNTAGQRNCYTEASGYGSMAGPGPSGFTFCSAENNTCTLPGPGNYDVAFGANDRFQVLMNLPPSSGPCSASYFGASTGQDSIPAWGMVRACYYRSSSGTGVPSGFSSTACGSEGALCQVTGRNVDVAYGLNGTFNVRTNIKDLFFCGSGIFGPVLPNTPGQRNCYVRDSDPGNMVGPAPTGYQLCGNENQTCSFQGETMDVAFGTSGTFILFTKVQNSVSCTVSNFGDPTPGIVKACYVRPSH